MVDKNSVFNFLNAITIQPLIQEISVDKSLPGYYKCNMYMYMRYINRVFNFMSQSFQNSGQKVPFLVIST